MMKHVDPKRYAIMKQLIKMPGNIISLQGRDNITEFVLHDLSKDCFNFSKAAYFVDNPDFDCFKGLAGFSVVDQFEPNDIWAVPDDFSNHMKGSSFNNTVRQLSHFSPRKACVCDTNIIQMLSQELNLKNPDYFCWKMKHDNHGVILFEHGNGVQDWLREDLAHACHLLSLCPIF